jgi:hypothetical protein
MDKPTPKAGRRPLIWNLLTLIVVLGLLGVACYYLTIFMNPYSPLNPFPPGMLPTVFSTATPTITPLGLEATWTPTLTLAPSPSRTTAPTWTPLAILITPSVTATFPATDTLSSSPVPSTATDTPTPMPALATITYAASTIVHADSGCNWLGVGGQVLDAQGKPLLSQEVQLGGTLDGQPYSPPFVLSGSAAAYGTSGYEFVLSDHPIASTQTLWVELFDNKGKQLSPKVFFNTSDSCDQNLVRVDFKMSP